MWTGARANVAIKDSTVTRNVSGAILATGTDLAMDNVLVADSVTDSTKTLGVGLLLQADKMFSAPAKANVHRSLFENHLVAGIGVTGSELVLEQSVVRDTAAQPSSGLAGFAIHAQVLDAPLVAPKVTVRGSLLERSHSVGIDLIDAAAVVESSLVRDTRLRPSDMLYAVGIQVQTDKTKKASLDVRGSVISGHAVAGILSRSSDVTLDGSVVASIAPDPHGQFGFGVVAETSDLNQPGSMTITRSIVRDASGIGLSFFGTDATVTDTEIAGIIADPNGGFGDGITVTQATAAFTRVRVRSCARSGVAGFGASLTLDSSAIRCNAIDLDGEHDGDSDTTFAIGSSDVCGCDAASPCQVLSSNLAPPVPLKTTK
jgi:hypothetical protein